VKFLIDECLAPRVADLLATSGDSLPSVILLRRNHDAASQAAGILAALPDIEDSLSDGAIVAITPDRVRIRALPIN
jgi:predicted nuclease of predicted toxin-antitoxin system